MRFVFNLFMPSGPFCLKSFDRSISNSRSVLLAFYYYGDVLEKFLYVMQIV